MDSLHSTMNQHVKGKHLSFEERVIIHLPVNLTLLLLLSVMRLSVAL